MLKIRTDQDEHSMVFRLEGDLVGLEVLKMERRWQRTAHLDKGCLCLDLRRVGEIDDSGKHLLERMFAGGAELLVAPHGPHSIKAGDPKPGCVMLQASSKVAGLAPG